jgi:hypothetical protein
VTIPARVAVLVAALLTAPCVAVCGGCAAVTACHATYTATGPYVRAGEVWDDLRVWCSPSPASHALTARMLYRAVGAYAPLGRAVYTARLPGASGFTVSPHATCVSGWYQATATVTATDTAGHTSEVTLTGLERHVTVADCAGGTR